MSDLIHEYTRKYRKYRKLQVINCLDLFINATKWEI